MAAKQTWTSTSASIDATSAALVSNLGCFNEVCFNLCGALKLALFWRFLDGVKLLGKEAARVVGVFGVPGDAGDLRGDLKALRTLDDDFKFVTLLLHLDTGVLQSDSFGISDDISCTDRLKIYLQKERVKQAQCYKI